MAERRANRNYIRHLETIEELLENGAGGGGTPYAVKYTAQSLSSSEQSQARTNIGAAASSALSGKQDTLVSGTNIKTVGGQSLLGSGNVTVNDTSAVKFDAAQSLTTAQKQQARQNIGAISADEMTNMEYVTAAIRPEASANTMGKIYMIGPDANDEYERYFTQEVGGVYSWVPLGSTEIDLSGYATDDEVAQLEHEVGNFDVGEWEIGSILPDTNSDGYIPDVVNTARLRLKNQQTVNVGCTLKMRCNSAYSFVYFVANNKKSTTDWEKSASFDFEEGDVFRVAIKKDDGTDFSGYTADQIAQVVLDSGFVCFYGDAGERIKLVEDSVTTVDGKVAAVRQIVDKSFVLFSVGDIRVNGVNQVRLGAYNYLRKGMQTQQGVTSVSTFTFDSTNGYVLVFTDENELVQRANMSAVLNTDTVLLTYNDTYGYTSGVLLPRVLDFLIGNGETLVFAVPGSLSVNENQVTVGALNVRRKGMDEQRNIQVSSTFTFDSTNGYALVLTNSNTVVQRTGYSAILVSDTVLLTYNPNYGYTGGLLLPRVLDLLTNKDKGKELVFFVASRMGATDNKVTLYGVNYKRTGMSSQASVVVNTTFTFDSTNGYALVFTGENTLAQRVGMSAVLNTDTILLTYNPNYGFTGGLLLPRVLDILAQNEEPSGLTTKQYRDICIALLNKLAQRYGLEKSTILAPDGGSIITAKELTLMVVAGISNNIISTIWAKDVDYGTVYGPHARIDEYPSSFKDPVSHPFVAELGDYYHIWGGKTGSQLVNNEYVGRNLCCAVKSKVDDAWLVGSIVMAQSDVAGDNRFSMMKEMFDLLEQRRTGASVDASGLNCTAAFAMVLPDKGNIATYQDYDGYVSVGKNENALLSSFSTTKIFMALVVAENIRMFDLITVKDADIAGYGGHSGNMYQDGDELSILDTVKSIILTSSSHACWFDARLIGQKYMETNKAPLFVFRLLDQTAYCVGASVSWLSWIDTPDYAVWSAITGITLSCEGENSPVVKSTGGNIQYGGDDVTGASLIVPNANY